MAVIVAGAHPYEGEFRLECRQLLVRERAQAPMVADFHEVHIPARRSRRVEYFVFGIPGEQRLRLRHAVSIWIVSQ